MTEMSDLCYLRKPRSTVFLAIRSSEGPRKMFSIWCVFLGKLVNLLNCILVLPSDNRQPFLCRILDLTLRSGFSQMHKIGNIAIVANFVFLYHCSFILHSRFSLITQIWHFWHFCTKLASRCLKKIKLPPVGFELTTLTITGLQVWCWSNWAKQACVESFRFSDPYKIMLYWI